MRSGGNTLNYFSESLIFIFKNEIGGWDFLVYATGIAEQALANEEEGLLTSVEFPSQPEPFHKNNHKQIYFSSGSVK